TIAIHAGSADQPVPELLAQIESLTVAIGYRAKIVVNERTGTIVMGGDISLSPVAVMHGGLTIEVETQYSVSQPNALGGGETVVLPQTTVTAGRPSLRLRVRSAATRNTVSQPQW